DGGGAAFCQKLFERELKAALAAVRIDGRLRVVGRHQRLDGVGAYALGSRLAGELLLPGFIAAGGVAAGGGVGLRARTSEHSQREKSGKRRTAVHQANSLVHTSVSYRKKRIVPMRLCRAICFDSGADINHKPPWPKNPAPIPRASSPSSTSSMKTAPRSPT